MRLSASSISNFANVNAFTFSNQWSIRAGEPNTLYFQLVDLDNAGFDGNNPQRFIPGITDGSLPVSMVVTFPSINTANIIHATATQNAFDASIWSISLTNLQTPSSGNVMFSITEGSVTRTFAVINLITVEIPQNMGSC